MESGFRQEIPGCCSSVDEGTAGSDDVVVTCCPKDSTEEGDCCSAADVTELGLLASVSHPPSSFLRSSRIVDMAPERKSMKKERPPVAGLREEMEEGRPKAPNDGVGVATSTREAAGEVELGSQGAELEVEGTSTAET